MSIIKILFSVRNENIHKVITIMGLKFKFKSKKLMQKLRFEGIERDLRSQRRTIAQQKSMIDNLQEQIDKKINNQQNKINNLTKQLNYKLSKYMSPEKYPEFLKDWYFEKTGETLNLENPQTFNEKIQWLKLYDSTPLKTRLADKYLVRDWVKEKIGEEYLIPLLGVWDNFDEIDFNTLPDKFVLKCNHGCGYNIIVTDKSKLDIDDARKKINTWMNEDFAYRGGLELHYHDIEHKIIAEKYIENSGNDLYDYKFWCFNGEVKYIQFLSERNTNGLKMAYYDSEWNKQEFITGHKLDEKILTKPENLDLYIKTVEKLVKDLSFVRADFYIVKNKLYFGELTFTPFSGCEKWTPKKYNLQFGQIIQLPTESRKLCEISQPR